MEIIHPDSNRVGQFNVLFELHDPRLTALLSMCTVLHSEPHESGRGQTYIAASPLFEPLAEGDEIPGYRIECAWDMPFAQPDHEARRLNVGLAGFVAVRQHIIRVPALQTQHAAARPH